MKRIVADAKRCLACRTCELACALAYADSDDLVRTVLSHRAGPRIYIEAAGRLAVPLQCRHCADAPCLRVCPSAALWRPDEAGPVLVRQERCIGCAFCVQACPFGVIRVARWTQTDATDKGLAILKCDLCQRQQAAGQPPACVASCPVQALKLEEVEEGARRMRAITAAGIGADGDGDAH
ncbi:MAG: 4Fe-4S dicluster domain-containing protein [Thermoguttaceae bacterium]